VFLQQKNNSSEDPVYSVPIQCQPAQALTAAVPVIRADTLLDAGKYRLYKLKPLL
jgi:hypothetical protein